MPSKTYDWLTELIEDSISDSEISNFIAIVVVPNLEVPPFEIFSFMFIFRWEDEIIDDLVLKVRMATKVDIPVFCFSKIREYMRLSQRVP